MEHPFQYDIDPQSSPESQPDPISPKEQKAYEKKLKQYEKDKARWDYFQANKERILKNKQSVERRNSSSNELMNKVETGPSAGGYEVTYVNDKYGFVDKTQIINFLASHLQTSDSGYTQDEFVRRKTYFISLMQGSSKVLEEAIIGLQLQKKDIVNNLIPIYLGSYVYTMTGDDGLKYMGEFNVFSFPPLPKKPIPPEAPKAKVGVEKKISDLKQEIITSKEMELSRKIYGDTVPTKLEVISNGKTIKVDQQTYDLYNQFKATRKERPHDLNYSFEHFQTTYLDKHPQFMRKQQKEK